MQIETPGPADVANLRTKLTSLGLGEIQLQSFGQPNEVLIRFPEQAGGPEARKWLRTRFCKNCLPAPRNCGVSRLEAQFRMS